ncbi:MAG: M48 family metalloprotease [Cyclobacteriaceae bacterium]|nr:M48 family metalloprotease [Cyclobacteriaceae bacterium]
MRVWICFIALSYCTLVQAQNYSLDKKLGEENARRVVEEMGLYEHDSLQWLVNAVGQKLVSRLTNKPFDFHFNLVDSQEPNAFALPGGYIYVTRGILPLIQTEDELAGVLAHEIIHVMERHSVKQMRKGTVTGLLRIPGNIINSLTGTKLGNVLNAPIALVTGSYVARYSRGHESEADKFGIQLAASAGYNANALADVLGRISKAVEAITGETEKRGYLNDHPFTPSRVTAIRNSAGLFKPVNPSPVTRSQHQFFSVFDGLVYGTNPKQGIFIDSLFVHPDLDFSFIVPSNWITENKPTGVAAIQEKGEAIISLQLADGSKTPRQLGEEVGEKAGKQKEISVLQAADTVVNSIPGYVLRIKTESSKETLIMEIIWLAYHKNVYQLTGLSKTNYSSSTHQSLTSFRQATSSELNRVQLYLLRVVAASKNETLQSVAQRNDNRLNKQFIELFNNMATDQSLSEGALVRIITEQQYRLR